MTATYVMVEGGDPITISERFEIPVEALKAQNKLPSNEIKVGDKLIFEDMAIYSMVKNNTFNGIPLPDIVLLHKDGTTELVRRFGYEDFKGRLS